MTSGARMPRVYQPPDTKVRTPVGGAAMCVSTALTSATPSKDAARDPTCTILAGGGADRVLADGVDCVACFGRMVRDR